MKGDLGSKGRRTIGGSVLPPFSCIMGNDVKVNEVVETLVRYYFPRATRIWDPTCGRKTINSLLGLEIANTITSVAM